MSRFYHFLIGLLTCISGALAVQPQHICLTEVAGSASAAGQTVTLQLVNTCSDRIIGFAGLLRWRTSDGEIQTLPGPYAQDLWVGKTGEAMATVAGHSRPYGIMGGALIEISVGIPSAARPLSGTQRFEVVTEIRDGGMVAGDPSHVEHLFARRRALHAEFTYWEGRINELAAQNRNLLQLESLLHLSDRDVAARLTSERQAARQTKEMLLRLTNQLSQAKSAGRMTESQQQQILRFFVESLGSRSIQDTVQRVAE